MKTDFVSSEPLLYFILTACDGYRAGRNVVATADGAQRFNQKQIVAERWLRPSRRTEYGAYNDGLTMFPHFTGGDWLCGSRDSLLISPRDRSRAVTAEGSRHFHDGY
jgi:hypothetical protein